MDRGVHFFWDLCRLKRVEKDAGACVKLETSVSFDGIVSVPVVVVASARYPFDCRRKNDFSYEAF